MAGKQGPVDAADVMRFLSQVRDVPVATFRSHLYQIENRQAIRHMLRVVSGLDSMVLGEAQIVNQLKQAYQLATEEQSTGAMLHAMFQAALKVARRVG